MKENIYNACKAADCLEWYKEQKGDPAKWKKVKHWYIKQCPPKEVNGLTKMGSFKVMQYQTAVRAEQQQIRDGVREMMHLAKFQAYAAKPKNYPPRGLDADSAKVEFFRLADEEGSVVDFNGLQEGFKQQVGILTQTLVIDRNLLARQQGYTVSDKLQKNFSQSDVDKNYMRLHTSMEDPTT